MRLVFDRGTLLLLDAPPPASATVGPAGLAWDARVSAWRAPACRHSELVNALVRGRVRFTDDVRQVDQPLPGWLAPALRPYQEAALSAWELSGRRGVVVLPTGSGKTRVAIAAMARTGLATLCLVPTRVLLEQWLGEVAAAYPHAVGCLGDSVHDLAPITVATFESGYRQMDRLGNRFDLVVVDEAHHFGAGMRDEALEMAIAPARLGLTATPPHDERQAARLGDLLGATVYELAISDLTGRFLAPFETITLHLDLGPDERETYDALMGCFRAVHEQFQRLAPGGSWEDFARTAARSAEGRRALAAWRQARKLLAFTAAKRVALRGVLDRHRDARTLVFTSDNETAYAIAREHLIMPLTCDVGRQERVEALDRFRRGELRALVSARVLNEGLDVPDADVAVIVGGALGEREHVQRVGRLLRPGEGKRALVYELVMRRTMEVGQARKRRKGLAPRVSASA
jgi:superfamily II DNA or RNA helicase